MTRRLIALVGAVLSLLATARAEPREVAASLSLADVVRAALTENPDLRAARARWEAMQERPVQQTTLPNPMISYSGMDATDRGSFPNTSEKRVMVEQTVPWFGKLGLKGQVAGTEAESTGRAYEAMVRDVLMRVKATYFELYAVQQSLSITAAEQDVLERMQAIAETKYSTGTASQQDVLKAQAEISMLKARLLDLDQQAAVLKARLNQLLNRRADAPLGLAVTVPAAAVDSEAGPLFDLAEQTRPEIRQAVLEVERGQRQRALMRKEFFPDYRLGVEYRSVDRGPDMVMFTVGVDLPIWQTKYRAGLREADKLIEASKAALEAARRETAFDVQDAHFQLVTARRTLELYRTALVPQAEARLQASEAGYRTGQVDFLDLLESERFLLTTRVLAAQAEGQVGIQSARLERAVGTDLPPNQDAP